MKRVSSQIARFLLPAIYVESLDAQVAFEAFFFFAARSSCPSRFLFCNTPQSLLCSSPFVKSYARLICSVVTAFSTVDCRYQLFARGALSYPSVRLHFRCHLFCNETLASYSNPKQLDYKNSSLSNPCMLPEIRVRIETKGD